MPVRIKPGRELGVGRDDGFVDLAVGFEDEEAV
jgi:hypothetical protein